jgi:hypothetical protein
LVVAAHHIRGFQFYPPNASAEREHPGITERHRLSGVDVVEDGEDVTVQCDDLVPALETYPVCHRRVKDDVGRQQFGDRIRITAFPGGT